MNLRRYTDANAALYSFADGRAGIVRGCVKFSTYRNKAAAWVQRAEWIPAAA